MSEDFPALAGFRAGSLLAGYRLEAQVGTGGMAVVFRARDERLGRLVALKILAPVLAADGMFRRRFIAESRAAAAVDDPHIIPVHEAGEADGVLFIAMRFVQGGDLRRVMEQEGALPPDRAAGFISPVASALDAAHAAGLVHRDVKPANILVDARPGRPDHVYVSDFGVSKVATASVSLTGAGQFLGTPGYSAPEQIQGRAVDGRTDQYALACVAYQLLTGELPFDRDQGMAVLLAHLSEPPPSLGVRLPGLPAAADEVLARGMAKVPEKRYGSCGEFADALREALGLAPYSRAGTAATADHPHTQIGSLPPGLPGPVAASLAADASLPITVIGPPPVYSAVGQAGAAPAAGLTIPPGGSEQRAAPAPRDDHHRAVTGGPGPSGKMPRAPRPGRAIRHRSVIIAAAVGIAVAGLVIAVTTFSGTPHRSAARPRSLGTPNGSASSHASGSPGGSLLWTYTMRSPVVSGPAVAGGTVYVGGMYRGEVYALNAATGQVRWARTTEPSTISVGSAFAGSVYAGGTGGQVYALDAVTGQVRWTYTTRYSGYSGVYSGPVVAGGTVYVGAANIGCCAGGVYALNAASGQVRWSYITGYGGFYSVPAMAGGTVYAVASSGRGSGQVYALDAATGKVRWTHTTAGTPGIGAVGPAVAGGTVYVGSGGTVYALDAATGQVRWTYTSIGDGVASGPVVAGGTVYVGGGEGTVYALNAATGQVRWTHTTAAFGVYLGSIYSGSLYVASGDGEVYALNAATGQVRWTRATGYSATAGYSISTGPAVADGTVYVGSQDKVYALNAGS